MKKNTCHLVSMIIAFVLLHAIDSCKKGGCGNTKDEVVYYNIPDTIRGKIPYSGRDTLVFVSNKGDTTTFIGEAKKEYYIIDRTPGGSPECHYYYIQNFENSLYKFHNGTEEIEFRVFIYEGAINDTYFTINYSNSALELFNAFDYFYRKLPDDSIVYSGNYLQGRYLSNKKIYLFNKELGILRFNDNSGFVWTLISKS